MKILHIIPSAFDYFDDIKRNAMVIAEEQKKAGFFVEAFTVQYHGFSPKQAAENAMEAPSLNYQGIFSSGDVLSQLNDYDIIHIHAPFFGIIKKIISLVKQNQQKFIIIVSYWRDPKIVDIFSIFIYLYNYIYIKKLSWLAGAQLIMGSGNNNLKLIQKWIKKCNNIYDLKKDNLDFDNIHLTPAVNELKLNISAKEAIACLSIYYNLLNNQ